MPQDDYGFEINVGLEEELEDLLSAAVSSMEFWDNGYDDEDWNNA